MANWSHLRCSKFNSSNCDDVYIDGHDDDNDDAGNDDDVATEYQPL